MNDNVRDVIARIVWANHVRLPGEWPYEAGNDLEHGIANDTADSILFALDKARYVVVREDRVREATHLDWVIDYARLHDGFVKVSEARVGLVNSGRLRAGAKKANVYNHLWNLLVESEEFEYVEPGVFRYCK